MNGTTPFNHPNPNLTIYPCYIPQYHYFLFKNIFSLIDWLIYQEGGHSMICLTIFFVMLVIDVIGRMLLNTSINLLVNSVLNVCIIKKLFSCFSFKYKHSDSSNIFYYFIKIWHNVNNIKTNNTDIKITLETNARTQISGGCVTRNDLDFYLQLKSYHTLSPAYSCLRKFCVFLWSTFWILSKWYGNIWAYRNITDQCFLISRFLKDI